MEDNVIEQRSPDTNITLFLIIFIVCLLVMIFVILYKFGSEQYNCPISYYQDFCRSNDLIPLEGGGIMLGTVTCEDKEGELHQFTYDQYNLKCQELRQEIGVKE